MLEGDFEGRPLQLHLFTTTHLVVVRIDTDEIFLISDLLPPLLLSRDVCRTATHYLLVDLEGRDSHVIGRTSIDLILLELEPPWDCFHAGALADVLKLFIELDHLADELLQPPLLFSISLAHYLQLALDLFKALSLFPQAFQEVHFLGEIRQGRAGSKSGPLLEQGS